MMVKALYHKALKIMLEDFLFTIYNGWNLFRSKLCSKIDFEGLILLNMLMIAFVKPFCKTF